MEIKNILAEALSYVNRAKNIELNSQIQADAFRWEIYASLQNILGALTMVIAELNLRKPSSYSEMIDILYENGILDERTRKVMKNFSSLRNILAHAYRRISIEELKKLKELIPDIERIIKELNDLIENKDLDPEIDLRKHDLEIDEIFKKHKVKIAYLFGSRARGFFREDSDYDIAVLFDKEEVNLLDESNLAVDISEKLNIPVDKIDVTSLNKNDLLVIARVLKEGKIIYQEDENF